MYCYVCYWYVFVALRQKCLLWIPNNQTLYNRVNKDVRIRAIYRSPMKSESKKKFGKYWFKGFQRSSNPTI